jgi:flagellar biosynthesis/type III secretory pathway M-ring protein FliF/YscJ
MNSFLKGVITGAAGVLVLVLLVLAFRFFYNRDRKIYEYMEAQHELQDMRENIGNRPPDEFLEDPGVRGAADNAAADFQRKRDEAVQRIRSGHPD